MEIEDLVGEHELSGVDSTTETVRFVLDGKTYKATEDSDDGYRSYLKDIEVTDEKVSTNFPAQKVVGTMKDGVDIIQFIDAVNGKVVLEVGTDNRDDYYPYCVLSWSPENLHINKHISKG